jgi:signal transduction histidine kinase
VEAMGTEERQVAQGFRNLLGNAVDDPRIALVKRGPELKNAAGLRDEGLPFALQISARLSDGNWLNGEAPLQLPIIRQGERVAIPLIAVSVVSILIAMIFAVRWITRPLTALADAADRVGRGHIVEPLATSGPDEVSRTVNAFNVMQQRLRHFVMERLAMLTAISHDLRTPLTAARLRAEMIDDTEVKTAIIRSLTDVQHIAEATLDFARDETLSEEPRIVDLSSLVEAIAEDSKIVGHDVTIVIHDPLPYRCRPALLRRALTNLISNANKYGKRARIALEVTNEQVLIIIDDEGPGIPDDQLEKVFEPFFRIDQSRSHETGGIGLGLSIARSVVRAHGGEVKLINQICGLRAEVTLPTYAVNHVIEAKDTTKGPVADFLGLRRIKGFRRNSSGD